MSKPGRHAAHRGQSVGPADRFFQGTHLRYVVKRDDQPGGRSRLAEKW